MPDLITGQLAIATLKYQQKNMNWHLIYTTALYTQAAIVQGKLEENNIPVKMLNRQDTMYISIGEIELYVPVHLKDLAMGLMNETLKN